MIIFVDGKPGGGKGRCFAEEIETILRDEKRVIICAFASKIEPWVNGGGSPQVGLKHHLLLTYGKSFDCEKRIFFLDEIQAREFYLWRVKDGALVRAIPKYKDGRATERSVIESFDTSLLCSSEPTTYFIDEAGLLFGSRDWATTGSGLIFYAAQHRKPGDNLYLASQNWKDVDVALIRKTEAFWRCRNRSLLRHGIFRLPADFKVYIYEHPPTGRTGETPQYVKTYKYEKNDTIFQTFDTSSGVGLVGKMVADMSSKRKGIPFFFYFVFAFAAVILMLVGLHYGSLMFAHHLAKGSMSLTKTVYSGFTNAASQAAVSYRKVADVPPSGPVLSLVPSTPTNNVDAYISQFNVTPNSPTVVGRYFWSGHEKFILSNGRELDAAQIAAFNDTVIVTRSGLTLLIAVYSDKDQETPHSFSSDERAASLGRYNHSVQQ